MSRRNTAAPKTVVDERPTAESSADVRGVLWGVHAFDSISCTGIEVEPGPSPNEM